MEYIFAKIKKRAKQKNTKSQQTAPQLIKYFNAKKQRKYCNNKKEY